MICQFFLSKALSGQVMMSEKLIFLGHLRQNFFLTVLHFDGSWGTERERERELVGANVRANVSE